jgi:stearoyl-CoA desaturase (Delta-9 desaturase)
MIILFFFAIHWYTSLFLQSFFQHRYAAHQHFKMSKFWERFFYICCFVAQGSSYISPRAYGIMHRLHHAQTDTHEDPHSPFNYSNFFKMMLATRNNYFSIYSGKIKTEPHLAKGLPAWQAFDKIAHNWISRFVWIMLYLCFYTYYSTSVFLFLLLPVTIMIGTVQGAVVNFWAHKFGYVNYKTNNHSKNRLHVDVLFAGEAYHNNHHNFPGNPNNARKWFEFDITFQLIKLFHYLRIIKIAATDK